METDWSVAAGGDDPLIVVPWESEVPWEGAADGARFVDLRQQPEAQAASLTRLPEAVASPALARSLVLLNASDGVLMTSKCDRWQMDAEERAELAGALDAPVELAGFASYIDVLLVHPVPMADFLLHEEWVRGTALRCAALDHPAARLDLIVRPAQVLGQWGYGISMYVYAGGDNSTKAEAAWAAALEACVVRMRAEAEASIVEPSQDAGLPA